MASLTSPPWWPSPSERSSPGEPSARRTRQETDHDKRKEYIWTMQEMLHESLGPLIPVFRDWIDAHSSKVGGHTPHAGFDFDNGRIAEKAWLEA